MSDTLTSASSTSPSSRRRSPEVPADAAAIAHVLRRGGFGPAPGAVEAAGSYAAALEQVIASGVDDGAEIVEPDDDDADPPIAWWVARMLTTPHGLHEKMVLFWHSMMPSSANKVSADMLARQHDTFRRHALGNFRDLVHAIVHDAAMLQFLDAAGSRAPDPNENLARELMELFTLGRGNYDESDVRAAAAALAGFTVDWDSEAVGFDEEAANTSSLTILGVTDRFDPDRLVDVICDHPACPPFVARRLFEFFVGRPPDRTELDALAGGFRDRGLEVAPLVEQILRSPAFETSRLARHRLPIEWFVALHHALGQSIAPDSIWTLDELGQMPWYPPNVAGWHVGPQWVSPGGQLLRAAVAVSADLDHVPGLDAGDEPAARVDAALVRCGLFEVSGRTRAALDAAARRRGVDQGGDPMLVALTMASPEAACC